MAGPALERYFSAMVSSMLKRKHPNCSLSTLKQPLPRPIDPLYILHHALSSSPLVVNPVCQAAPHFVVAVASGKDEEHTELRETYLTGAAIIILIASVIINDSLPEPEGLTLLHILESGVCSISVLRLRRFEIRLSKQLIYYSTVGTLSHYYYY